jgi:hypothetical protein
MVIQNIEGVDTGVPNCQNKMLINIGIKLIAIEPEWIFSFMRKASAATKPEYTTK